MEKRCHNDLQEREYLIVELFFKQILKCDLIPSVFFFLLKILVNVSARIKLNVCKDKYSHRVLSRQFTVYLEFRVVQFLITITSYE